jgi:hypothetical protein
MTKRTHNSFTQYLHRRGWRSLLLCFTMFFALNLLLGPGESTAAPLTASAHSLLGQGQTVTATLTTAASSTATATVTLTATPPASGTVTVTPPISTLSATATSAVGTSPPPTPSWTPTFTPLPTAAATSTLTPLPTPTPTWTPPLSPIGTPTPAPTQVLAPAILDFAVDRNVLQSGESGLVRWRLARALSATLSYNGIEQPVDATAGTLLMSPLTTTVYSLVVSGAGGQVAKELTVAVQMPTSTPVNRSPLADAAALASLAATETMVAEETERSAETVAAVTAPTETPTPSPTAIVVEVASPSPAAQAPVDAATPTPAAVALDLRTRGSPANRAVAAEQGDARLGIEGDERVRLIALYGVVALGVVAPAALLILGLLLSGIWRKNW